MMLRRFGRESHPQQPRKRNDLISSLESDSEARRGWRELAAERRRFGWRRLKPMRMRHAGRLTFLEFHLVVPGAMTVAEAHAICDRIESALRAEMEGLRITIHVEPEARRSAVG